MKNFLFTIIAIVTLVANFPIASFAQTSDENWVSLQDYLKDTYKLANKTIAPGSTNDTDLRFVSKLAFKKNASEILPLTALHLQRFNMDNGVPTIEKDEIVISNGFDITEKGKKTKKKELPTSGEWTIFDLEGAAVVTSVTGVSDNYGFNSAILKNIYVTLDPTKDPLSITTAYLEKKQSEAQQAKQSAFENSLYTTPQKAGYTIERTDNLPDGTVVEHYKEGIRFIKKPNGDFASFIQPKDTRDEKTLSPIKGTDVKLTRYDRRVGDFQLTFDNGVILREEGSSDKIIFPNGKEMKSTWNSKYEILEENLPTGKKINTLWDTYDINFDFFINPSVDIANRNIKNYTPKISYLPKPFMANPKMVFQYEDENGNKINVQPYTKSLLANAHSGSKPYEYVDGSFLVDMDSPQLYVITSEGLSPYGIYDSQYSSRDIPLPLKFRNKEDNTYFFTNGDFINRSDYSLKLTLHDGTVIECFPDMEKFKISHPNGDYFVGEIGGLVSNTIERVVKEYIDYGVYNYRNGTLFKADGKEIAYKNGLSEQEIAKQQQEVEKAYQAIVTKYGKSNVENAVIGNIKTGMKFQMLKDLGLTLIRDEQIGNYTWYKLLTEITYNGDMKYKWLRVNNNTDVIDYVGTTNKRPIL